MSALRWLAHGDWSAARMSLVVADHGELVLTPAATGYARRGVAVLRAGSPDPSQIDTSSADRWRRVRVRLADPVPSTAWLRVWTLVASGAGAPADPEPASGDDDQAPVPTPVDRWRAAAVDAIDVRVLCPDDGQLWVAVELGGSGAATPRVADLEVRTGDDGPVTLLPTAYRATTEAPAGTDADVDSGDGVLGRYLGLLGAELDLTSSLIEELPALLSSDVTPDRPDAPWLKRLATWVALDPALLPADAAARRETVATAVQRHGWRGTRRGLLDQVARATGMTVEVVEPLEQAAVWRLDITPDTSALGLTTGLTPADPGPPALDTTAWLDASMLIEPDDAGLPVHAHLAHRICVHVPGGSAADVAAVDVVVQRERPAHVLARTCATARVTSVPTVVGVNSLPGPGPAGLPPDPFGDARVGVYRLPTTTSSEGAAR